MTSNSETASKTKRTEGNSFYEKAKTSTDIRTKKNNVNQAIKCYEEAYNESNDDEEKYKASKNISLAYNLYSDIFKDSDLKNDYNLQEYTHLLSMLFKSVIKEIEIAKTYFDLEDHDEFDERYNKIEETLEIHINKLLSFEKFAFVIKLIEILKPYDYLYALFTSKIINFYYNKGNSFYQIKEYDLGKSYLGYLVEFRKNILEDKDYYAGMKSGTKEEIEDIYNKSNLLMIDINASKWFEKGDNYIKQEIDLVSKDSFDEKDISIIKLSIENYKTAYNIYLNEKNNGINPNGYSNIKELFLNKLTSSFYNLFKSKKVAYSLSDEFIELIVDNFPFTYQQINRYLKIKKIISEFKNVKDENEEETTAKEEKENLNENNKNKEAGNENNKNNANDNKNNKNNANDNRNNKNKENGNENNKNKEHDNENNKNKEHDSENIRNIENDNENNKLFDEFKSKNEDIFKNLKKYSEKGILDFTEYILKKYPFIGYNPIQFDYKKMYIKSKKTLLKKLCVYYHPDKYPRGTEKEIENYFIVHEICKYITTAYNSVKE